MQGKQSWLILLVNLIINTRTAQPDGFPPQFDGAQKIQYRAVVGQVVRLRCIVKGKPRPTITWTKNEKPLQLSHRIKTSNNRTVRIKGAIPSDQGNYSCFVENLFGKINMTMQLTVGDVLTTSRTLLSTTPVLARDLRVTSYTTTKSSLGAPRFAEPEKLKRAFIAWPASHTIRLKCKATGAPPLKYTWLKDGKRIISRRLDPYINTTVWFLRLKDLVPTDSGKYTCNVSNPYGSINHTYTVKVVAKPRSKPILHSSFPKNASVQLGGNATMKCVVLISGTLPDFRWLKWDNFTTANPKIKEDGTDNGIYHLINPIHYKTIKEGEHYGVELVIVNVTEEDLGLYTCYVSNHIGIDYRSALLSRFEKSTVSPSNEDGFTYNGESTTHETLTRMSALAENLPQKKSSPTGQIALILLAAFVGFVVIGVVLFVFCYRKRFQDKLSGETKPPVTEIRLQEVDSTPPTSTLIPQEGESPSQTDRTVRMFTYPVPRGRKSSTGSINSTTSLIKYRHGSHRSRLSSGVSSRLDSNITEEEYPELPCDEEWEIDRSQITLREQLGEGAFGLVMRADALALPNMPAKCSVAVKMLKADATENELADLLSEMDTMKEIGSHKNIINLIGACTQNGSLFVVVEFAPFGNLRQFLRERRPPSSDYQRPRPNSCGPSLTMRDFVSYGFQIARGMEYLGTRRCVHRDLAARNILVGEDYVMKIADFGLARNIRDMEYYRKTTDGRLPIKWLAIEALFDRVYTTQSDVWAFGILLWEIFTLGGSPYPGIPVEKLFDLLKSGYRMQKPQNCPSDIYDIMLNCWDENPKNRSSFTQLKMKFDAMLSSMTDKEYLEILAQSIEDIAQEMETPITDDSDVNNEVDAITESSC